jgi:ABC-2 type transport system ATP-binding protein
MISGNDTTIISLEIANLDSELIDSIRSLECVDAVTQENSLHLRIIVHGPEAFDNVIDAVRSKNGKINSMQNLQPTLEDVFLHITGHQVRDNADQKIPMAAGRHFGAPQKRVR